MSRSEIVANIERVQTLVAGAAARSGRPLEAVQIMAVTKTVQHGPILDAYHAGIRDFGENRVQEALPKIAEVQAGGRAKEARWHFIGTLQSNKARRVVETFATIHSVDRSDLAIVLEREAKNIGKNVAVYLEVNVAGEPSKSGFSPEDLLDVAPALVQFRRLQVLGLMTVAPLVQDPEEVRPVFRALHELRDTLRHKFGDRIGAGLSMGMSDDYVVAIEEGATVIRLGRAIFGARPAAPERNEVGL